MKQGVPNPEHIVPDFVDIPYPARPEFEDMIFNYDSIYAYLSDELRRRIRLNPNYSLRSFARNLKLSPGPLSEILRGQRDLSLKSVPNVARGLGLNAAESYHLLQLAQLAKTARDKDILELERKAGEHERHVVNEEIFTLISEWYHFAILNLVDVDGFMWSAAWIAKRLGITRIQSKMAMELLLKLGLVALKGGRIVGSKSQILAGSEIPSAAVRAYHRQILEKAAAALDGQSIQERDFNGTGFAVSRDQIPAIKKELSAFQDRLVAKFSKGPKSDVYFLEFALFKLTQGENV